MPKFPIFPYIFDEEKCISITDLKQLKYFNKNSITSGTINWTNRGVKTGSIRISVTIYDNLTIVEFDYKCNDTSYKYKVKLIGLPSNLGKGVLWYFICPFTGKRCRKLHLIDERFMHRSALPSGMYKCQTQSKYYRRLGKLYGVYFELDRLYEQLYKKHFKKTYAGKPTKRFLKLMNKIQQAEGIPLSEIERVMVK
jgi:hypothetical protein